MTQRRQKREGRPVQVYLDERTAGELEALARRLGRSLSDEVRAAVRRHLAEPPRLEEPPLDGGAAAPADNPVGKGRGKGKRPDVAKLAAEIRAVQARPRREVAGEDDVRPPVHVDDNDVRVVPLED